MKTTPIYWLALGTFAIGTEGFMIAPLIPSMAADLNVGASSAGLLVTAFALAYALSSPLLTALTGNFDRRRLLILAMAAFAIANMVAWSARDYWWLMGARILLAFAAGLYVPNANALAGSLVAPERRGRALAIVNGGTTMAIAFGVPLGASIGNRFGWRTTFATVGLMAAIAASGLKLGLHRRLGVVTHVVGLRERLAVVRKPAVLPALLVTTLWATGAYTVYTYIALLLDAATGIRGAWLSAMLFLWGISAAGGLALGGHRHDRSGPRAVLIPALIALASAFMVISVCAQVLSHRAAVAPVVCCLIIWGIAAWAFFPAQQARLIGIGGPRVAPVILSLNASFMFIGFSAGAALGSVVVADGAVPNLGWVGAACEIAALCLLLVGRSDTSMSTLEVGQSE
jgi:predicted MFS family arabinose efflux permease